MWMCVGEVGAGPLAFWMEGIIFGGLYIIYFPLSHEPFKVPYLKRRPQGTSWLPE